MRKCKSLDMVKKIVLLVFRYIKIYEEKEIVFIVSMGFFLRQLYSKYRRMAVFFPRLVQLYQST